MVPEILVITIPALSYWVLGGVLIYVGWRWGAFAARQALMAGSPKWKAYVVALIIPAALSAGLCSRAGWVSIAVQIFLWMATPAFITASLRYNASREY